MEMRKEMCWIWVSFFCNLGKLQVTVKASKTYPKDAEAPPCGVDDMTKLAYLHEPGVLQNLRSRYDMNEIYVSIQKQKVAFSFYEGWCRVAKSNWCMLLSTF
jgi:hypothetical protein